MLSENSIPMHPITGRHSLAPRSHTRTGIGLPHGSLSRKRDPGPVRAYHVPLKSHERVRTLLYAGSASSVSSQKQGEEPVSMPFWLEPVSRFGSSMVTALTQIHFCCPIPFSLAPGPPLCWKPTRCLTTRRCFRGVRCPEGFTPPDYSGRMPR